MELNEQEKAEVMAINIGFHLDLLLNEITVSEAKSKPVTLTGFFESHDLEFNNKNKEMVGEGIYDLPLPNNLQVSQINLMATSTGISKILIHLTGGNDGNKTIH